jgi:hypothetical protein
MTYRRHIKNGVAVLDEPAALPDGTRVRVQVEQPLQNATSTDVVPGKGDWDAALRASQQLKDYDYGAQADQDATDLRDAQDRLR